MSDETSSAQAQTPHERFAAQVAALVEGVTPEVKAEVADIVSPKGIRMKTITAQIAAILLAHHNAHNRDFGLPKVAAYARDMEAGLWGKTHQGFAFYDDGTLADGQHRCGAIVMSGVAIDVPVMGGFKKELIQCVDSGKHRTAADAAKLEGIVDPKLKESIQRACEEYERKVRGEKNPLGLIQLKTAIVENNRALDEVIEIGKKSIENIVNPNMSVTEAATIAHLMLRNGWDRHEVTQYLAVVQTGQADSEANPLFKAAEALNRSNRTDRMKERLPKQLRISVFFKGARMIAEGTRAVTRFPVKQNEPLASPVRPTIPSAGAGPA